MQRSKDEGWRDGGPWLRRVTATKHPVREEVIEAFLEEGFHITTARVLRWLDRFPQFEIDLLRVACNLIDVPPPGEQHVITEAETAQWRERALARVRHSAQRESSRLARSRRRSR